MGQTLKNHLPPRRPLRRAVDHTAALAVAALLYLAVVWVYRDERRQAGAR